MVLVEPGKGAVATGMISLFEILTPGVHVDRWPGDKVVSAERRAIRFDC